MYMYIYFIRAVLKSTWIHAVFFSLGEVFGASGGALHAKGGENADVS